jgi:two-component system, NarL family, nitrate/nitrite response regulator NarL
MRILIVDDSEPVRRGVAGMLSSDSSWQVCGEASNSVEALEKARGLRPDLVLLDISMPGTNGLETARLLRQENPAIKILIMSHHDAAQLLPSALEAGADGCVDKAQIATDLPDAIKGMAFPARSIPKAAG